MRIAFYLIILLTAITVGVTVATAKEYFKYTDRNGVVSWLDDKSKIPPQMPIHFKYEDNNGLTFWVDDAAKIPQEYKNKLSKNNENASKVKPGPDQSSMEKRLLSTKISINNNQIIVPVVFKNKGRKVKARMLLDTGASVTMLYSTLASDLHLKKNRLTKVKSISANGASTDSLLTKVDYIEVDDKILANAEVVVMPAHSNIGADGLLGNSFLRYFNFTIDYENQLLRWN